jgi:hypothetical protein
MGLCTNIIASNDGKGSYVSDTEVAVGNAHSLGVDWQSLVIATRELVFSAKFQLSADKIAQRTSGGLVVGNGMVVVETGCKVYAGKLEVLASSSPL